MKTIAEIDRCIDDARRKLEFTRKENVDSIEQFCGTHYKVIYCGDSRYLNHHAQYSNCDINLNKSDIT